MPNFTIVSLTHGGLAALRLRAVIWILRNLHPGVMVEQYETSAMHGGNIR